MILMIFGVFSLLYSLWLFFFLVAWRRYINTSWELIYINKVSKNEASKPKILNLALLCCNNWCLKGWKVHGIPWSGKWVLLKISSVQLCLTLCNSTDCSMPGFPVHHQLLAFTQTHVHWVGDAIQSSHSLSSPSPPTFNLSQHQGLFQWVSSSHQVAKVLEFQLQHQSFQWILRSDFL